MSVVKRADERLPSATRRDERLLGETSLQRTSRRVTPLCVDVRLLDDSLLSAGRKNPFHRLLVPTLLPTLCTNRGVLRM